MKIVIINHKQKNFELELAKILKQNHALIADDVLAAQIASIISDVRKNGDDALIKIANEFDAANFRKVADLLVSEREILAAKNKINKDLLAALKLSKKRICEYHLRQKPQDFFYEDELKIGLGNIWKPIERIGIYAPGGAALYPSSVLMSAVPALVAGVKDIILATPAKNGKVAPIILAAADLCGIKTIYKIGGAGAIAALALGTKTISAVDKIVGPGNNFVALAKKQLFGEVGIDMIAGPTDILIIANGKNGGKNNCNWIAADMLAQLEHGADSRAILITNDEDFANCVNDSIARLAKTLARFAIIKESLKNSAIIIVKNLELEAGQIANKIAPEHLQIMVKNPKKIMAKIHNAGAIFLGQYSPEAIGDYIAGPSHTLPTGGTARFTSGLSIFDFLKRISLISCSENGFKKLQKPTELLAESEGFDAHKLSVNIRK